MELTPQALHDVEFREARRGGYNTRDVDDFLERVAVGIGQLQDRLREAYHRAEAAEGRLAEMQRQLDDVQRRGPVESSGGGGVGDADETLRRTLVLAQRTADATIKEAKDEADRLLSEARDEVNRARAQAESDAHREARVELDELLAGRDKLLADIEALETHVDEQRENIRSSLTELQHLLDDPGQLSVEPPPEIADVSPPKPAPAAMPPAALTAPPAPSQPPQRVEVPAPHVEIPAPAMPAAPAASNGGSSNGAFSSPFAGVEFGKPPVGNGGPSVEDQPAAAFDGPPFDKPAFDGPSFDSPAFDGPPFDKPAFEKPPFEGPSFEPAPASSSPFDGPAFEKPPFEKPQAPFDGPAFNDPPFEKKPPFDGPAFDAPPFGSAPPPPARGDSSMVGDLQELHGSLPPAQEAPPPLPSRDPLGGREPLPSRDALPSREPLAGRDPLPSRDALPSREPLGGRDPLPARNGLPPTEPVSVPGPGQPGSTGFLPDLNAVFNPPGAPNDSHDDLALPMDAPPPPPPPGGFDHLQQGARPSEWGRGVFDNEDDSADDHPGVRFGRRG